MDEEKDFLDELVEEGTARDPEFPQLLAAAELARALMRKLVAARAGQGLSQADVAERMGTSQPAVARMEKGESDPRLSTIQRYAAVVGCVVETRATQPTVLPAVNYASVGRIHVRFEVGHTYSVELGDVGPAKPQPMTRVLPHA